jgi:hypothetical protein
LDGELWLGRQLDGLSCDLVVVNGVEITQLICVHVYHGLVGMNIKHLGLAVPWVVALELGDLSIGKQTTDLQDTADARRTRCQEGYRQSPASGEYLNARQWQILSHCAWGARRLD